MEKIFVLISKKYGIYEKCYETENIAQIHEGLLNDEIPYPEDYYETEELQLIPKKLSFTAISL